MCGIFGSTDSERFKTLYELNKDRGSFAYGGMYIHREQESDVQRTEGDCLQLEDIPGRQYYMGHTQGPTSAKRDFDPDTSHPFKFLSWHVAHNGVLSNSKVLAEEYKVDNPVDSAVLPKMVWDEYQKIWDIDIWKFELEQRAIKAVCEKLEGTFSCWLHNTHTNHVYLVRSGSTLFVDHKSGDFSSAHPGKLVRPMEALDDHAIYRVFYDADPIQKSKIEKVGHFDSHPPFFII